MWAVGDDSRVDSKDGLDEEEINRAYAAMIKGGWVIVTPPIHEHQWPHKNNTKKKNLSIKNN